MIINKKSDSRYNSICEKPLTKEFMEKTLKKDVQYFLTKLIAQKPTLVIIVDEKTLRLEEACRHLNPEIIEFRTFQKNEKGLHSHLVSRHLKQEIHAIKSNNGEFTCLLCDNGRSIGDAERIVEHIEQRHGIEYDNQLIEGWETICMTRKQEPICQKRNKHTKDSHFELD